MTDLSIFATEADLDAGSPTVITGTRIEQTVLARDLAGLVGSATIATVTQIPSKKPGQHPAWVWRAVNADTRGKVVAFANDREAKAAEALAAVPGFD